ncbi:hypothetical protein PSI15_18030, partial [Xenorhabdus sp. PR6a]|uniref:hypothetical protein n=1 Tax=Xenorhabdus sp. PR6a TaxID=3025877 RepID=UPI00235A15E2
WHRPNREAPCGGCTGRRGRARQRATERSAVRAARSKSQRGRGGGGKHGGRRPTCLQGGWPDAGRAAKEEAGWLNGGKALAFVRGVCQGLAQPVRAEGASLVRRHPAMPISGGTDIMQIVRCEPLCGGRQGSGAQRRISHNPLALC